MIINKDKQLGLILSDERCLQAMWAKIAYSEQSPEHYIIKQMLVNKNLNKYYLISKPAQEIAASIKIDPNINLNFIKNKLPDGVSKNIYLLDKDNAICLIKTDDGIVVDFLYRELTKCAESHSIEDLAALKSFHNLQENVVSDFKNCKETKADGDIFIHTLILDLDGSAGDFINSPNFSRYPNCQLAKERFKRHSIQVLKILFFVYASDIETVIVPGRTKIKYDNEKILNENNSEISIIGVNKNWNKTIIRTESFQVRGFCRMQPCGIDRMDRKLIYVAPFTKNGYVRRAKSETVKGEENLKTNST